MRLYVLQNSNEVTSCLFLHYKTEIYNNICERTKNKKETKLLPEKNKFKIRLSVQKLSCKK